MGKIKLGLALVMLIGFVLGKLAFGVCCVVHRESYRHASCLAINDARKIASNFTDMLRPIAYRRVFTRLVL